MTNAEPPSLDVEMFSLSKKTGENARKVRVVQAEQQTKAQLNRKMIKRREEREAGESTADTLRKQLLVFYLAFPSPVC